MNDPRQPVPERLLAEFPLPTYADWQAEAERLLKGVPFAKALVTRTLEGLQTVPLATAADTADLPWLDTLPGQPPYVRGAEAAGHRAAPWLVAQELPLPTAAEFNEALVHDLGRGQTAVHLVLDAAGRAGRDPDAAPAGTVGRGGTSVASLADLETALAGVDLAAVPLLLQAGASALPAAACVAALARTRGLRTEQLRGMVGGDPVAQWARQGSLPRPLPELRAEQAALVRWAAAQAPQLRTLPIHEDPWHDGGADGALGLGLVLAGAVEALRDLEACGVAPDAAAAQVQFHVCVASDFFLEIARLRALRLLWSRVLEAAGLVPRPACIHARTSARTQTVHDAHVNMLRAATQAFSAVLGGVQSLHVSPFDEVESLPDRFGRRIARNVQLLLLHETRADRVVDPAGGSWYVERLTADLAEAAWQRFQEVEAEGGLARALAAGTAQARVARAAEERRARLAVRKDVLVGTNRYADPAAPDRAPRTADLAALASRRAAEVAAARAGESVTGALAAELRRLLADDPAEAMAVLVDAAAAGATLGELNEALAPPTPAGPTCVPIPVRRDAAPFEELRRRVDALGTADPRRATVACACLGSLPRTLPRLEFTRGFFQAGGFRVVEGGFHPEPAAAAAGALATGAATVVLVALDDVYAAHGAELVRLLKAGAAAPQVLVAGQPADLVDALRAAGADGFIHLKSDLPETLGRLADHLEALR